MVVSASVLYVALGAGCKSGQAAAAAKMPPPEVSVARVVTRPMRASQDLTGRLQAIQEVELHPRVSGYIEAVHFQDGSHVKRGDSLFTIDARPFQQQVSRLEAERSRARTQLALAKADRQRGEHLLASGAISREGFERLTAAADDAGAALAAAEASLAAARLDVGFTRVRAPIEGRVSRALITPGNLVSNQSTLTTIVSDGDIYAYFELDESAYLRFARSDRATQSVQIGLAGEDGYPHRGALDFFDNQVDAHTGTIQARAVFENPDARLVPGLFVRVRFMGGRALPTALIDDKAVLTDQDRKYVYVLDPQNRAQRKNIAVGQVFDGLRVVSSGLSPGERVIVNGVQKVFVPGMPVHPVEVEMGAPGSQTASL